MGTLHSAGLTFSWAVRFAPVALAVRFAGVAGLGACLGAGVAGCEAESPPRGPEQTCAKACAVRVPQCSRAQCGRGCSLVLDRLTEHQGDPVLACVARRKDRCDDRAWAACAARVGPHADGGPPAPPPPSVDDDEDEE
jgi:hypothetical protein